MLASTLGCWSGHVLVVDCASAGCRRGRRVPVDALLPRWGELTVAGAIPRLDCSTCRSKPTEVTLRRLVLSNRLSRADLMLPLVGPEATRRR